MYLTKLYRHSKMACIILVTGCIIQLVIFYKQGAVATPFFNYGMYSDKIYPQEEYTVYKIYANGQLLKGGEFSIQDWDRVYVPLYMYLGKDSVNAGMLEVQNRLLKKLRLSPLSENNALFTNNYFDDADFMKWYKPYIASIVKKDIAELRIVKQQYKWTKTYLQPADSSLLFQ